MANRRANRRQLLGRTGEELAAQALEAAGFKIVARNFRTRLGELDLVARDGRVLVFVEVKARSGRAYGSGAEAVDWHKQQRLRRLACAFLGEELNDTAIRFDVVDVSFWPGERPVLRHIANAF